MHLWSNSLSFLHVKISLAFTDRKLELTNSSLETQQVLLQLSFLLLKDSNLTLQLLIFGSLLTKIFLQIFLYTSGLILKIGSDLLCF